MTPKIIHKTHTYHIHASAGGIWALVSNPKVLTAIAASIGVDVVKENWLSKNPEQMADQIRYQLQQQMKYELADALLAMEKGDKTTGTTDHHYVTYLLLATGLMMAGVITHQCRQQNKLQLQLLQERANTTA